MNHSPRMQKNSFKILYLMKDSIRENPLKITVYLPTISILICIFYYILFFFLYKTNLYSCEKTTIIPSPILWQYNYLIYNFSSLDKGVKCSAAIASHVFVLSVATLIICVFVSILNIKRYDDIHRKIVEKGVNFNRVLSSVVMFALFLILISSPSYFYYFSSVFYGGDIRQANPEIFFVSNSILFSICTAFLSFGFGFWPWWLTRGKLI